MRKASKSPYTFFEKIRMTLWWTVEALFFRTSFHKMNRWRCFLLRCFGSKIGNNTFIHPTAKIWFPWNFVIGSNSGVGFDALIYCLDNVTVGDFSTISQRVHINTGSHDYSSSSFKLLTKPVFVGAGAFIGTDSFIGWGVSVGNMAVVAARSVVVHSLPEYTVCGGHPCKPIKKYEMKD